MKHRRVVRSVAITMSSLAKASVKEYMDSLKRMPDPEDPLFLSQKKTRTNTEDGELTSRAICRQEANRILHRVLKRAGIARQLLRARQ